MLILKPRSGADVEVAGDPFDSLGLRESKALIPKDGIEEYKETRRFYDGDHWQDSKGWVGPMPPRTSNAYGSVYDEIEKAFAPRNVIAEVGDNHVEAVVGDEPRWTLALRRSLNDEDEPTDEEVALIAEAEAFLTEWWDQRAVHKTLVEFATTLTLAGRAVLRLIVPRGFLRGNQVPRAPVDESLAKVYPEHADIEKAAIAEDLDTRRQMGVFVGKDGQTVYADLVYEQGGDTVMRRATEDGLGDPVKLNLGGRLTMYQSERTPLISDPVKRQQRALNLALSMVPRNVVTGGFLERVITNAHINGTFEKDENGEILRFVPDPLPVGAGVTTVLRGVEYEDRQGNPHITQPSVTYREPVEVRPSAEAAEVHKRAIYEEVGQIHELISGDATASGVSREQAREKFRRSITPTVFEVEAATRWVLETALAMAEMFAGQPGRYTDVLRANVKCRLNLGVITITEQVGNAELADKGVISRETAMQRNGIEDTDAENARIQAEEGDVIGMVVKRAEAIDALTKAGAGFLGAAMAAGYSEEQAENLLKSGTLGVIEQ